MNPVSDTKRPKVVEYYCSSSIWRPAPSELEKSDPGGVTVKKRKENFPHILGKSEGIGCKVLYEERLPNI
jgi:hypothetical protein